MITAEQLKAWVELLRDGGRMTCEPARSQNIGRVIREMEAALAPQRVQVSDEHIGTSP